MLANSFVGEEFFLGVVLIGERLFFRDEIVDAVVTKTANHESPLSHFFLAESIKIPFPPMNGSRYQMMKRERLGAPA